MRGKMRLYRVRAPNARIRQMRVFLTIYFTKDEAIEPPTVAIITEHCGVVSIDCLQKRCATYILLEVLRCGHGL